MDENAINFMLSKLLSSNNHYLDTFSSNQLNDSNKLKLNLISKQQESFCFIVNTLSYVEEFDKLGHWLSIFITKNKNKVIIKYFDSFADNPSKYPEVSKYIDDIKKRCKQHRIYFRLEMLNSSIQSIYSKVCGIYVVYSIIKYHTHPNLLLKNIFEIFRIRDVRKNDANIMNFLIRHCPTNTCHLIPIYRNNKVFFFKSSKKMKTPPMCPMKDMDADMCMQNCNCN